VQGKPRHVCRLLSNYDHRLRFPQARPTFEFYELGPSEGVIVQAAGCKDVLCADDYRQLRQMLKANNAPAMVLYKAVEIVQRLSSQITHNIGTQCSSAVIEKKINTPIRTTYHSARPKDTVYLSDIVVAVAGSAMVVDYMKMQCEGLILAGPTIRANEDCWCGSGKKFKVCHKRKFGSLYARLPGFRRPMYLTFWVKGKRDVPIGTGYMVQSGFA